MIPSHERTDPGSVSRSDADGGQEVRRDAGPARGLFIVFEGGDGAGKTTQVNLLCTALQQRGHDVLTTREPGDTWLGGQIRHLVLSPDSGEISPKAEALLYNADKAQHLAEVVRPALEQGRIVVSDRYVDSTIAYQGAARALSVDGGAWLDGRPMVWSPISQCCSTSIRSPQPNVWTTGTVWSLPAMNSTDEYGTTSWSWPVVAAAGTWSSPHS